MVNNLSMKAKNSITKNSIEYNKNDVNAALKEHATCN
jgi:hypothetical protein